VPGVGAVAAAALNLLLLCRQAVLRLLLRGIYCAAGEWGRVHAAAGRHDLSSVIQDCRGISDVTVCICCLLWGWQGDSINRTGLHSSTLLCCCCYCRACCCLWRVRWLQLWQRLLVLLLLLLLLLGCLQLLLGFQAA
jgi:hypothetical protein